MIVIYKEPRLPQRSSGGRCVGRGAVRARVPRGVGEARLQRPEAETLGQDLREPQQDARPDRPSEAALMRARDTCQQPSSCL